MKNKNWPVIEIPPDGKRGVAGGGYCHIFIYSNQGNFLVKGFWRETEEYLRKRKQEGLKFFYNRLVFMGGGVRYSFWNHYDDCVSLHNPNRNFINKKWDSVSRKWHFHFKENDDWDTYEFKVLTFKRLPKRWIDCMDKSYWIKK